MNRNKVETQLSLPPEDQIDWLSSSSTFQLDEPWWRWDATLSTIGRLAHHCGSLSWQHQTVWSHQGMQLMCLVESRSCAQPDITPPIEAHRTQEQCDWSPQGEASVQMGSSLPKPMLHLLLSEERALLLTHAFEMEPWHRWCLWARAGLKRLGHFHAWKGTVVQMTLNFRSPCLSICVGF